jgi:hypothetical protein
MVADGANADNSYDFAHNRIMKTPIGEVLDEEDMAGIDNEVPESMSILRAF